jgi:hypothetical protein
MASDIFSDTAHFGPCFFFENPTSALYVCYGSYMLTFETKSEGSLAASLYKELYKPCQAAKRLTRCFSLLLKSPQ